MGTGGGASHTGGENNNSILLVHKFARADFANDYYSIIRSIERLFGCVGAVDHPAPLPARFVLSIVFLFRDNSDDSRGRT